MNQETTKLHELDLDLIEQYGFLENNEVDLSKKDFVKHDVVEFAGDYVSRLLQSASEYTNK